MICARENDAQAGEGLLLGSFFILQISEPASFARRLLFTRVFPKRVMDHQSLETILSLAIPWAKEQEELILARGVSLGTQHLDDARLAGVQDPSRVRVLVVERLPLPENPLLVQFARQNQILTIASRGCTFRYGIMIRADCWGDRELLVHNLVHVAQCEHFPDIETCIREYVSDRTRCAKFTAGSFEDEARRIARKICTG